MEKLPKYEVWQRGPVPEIPALLQPVAHALLQAREEVHMLMADFEVGHLWERPAGVASVGFHLQHLTGVLDRLFTYARGESLSPQQLLNLKGEGQPSEIPEPIKQLVNNFDDQVDKALQQLRYTQEHTLTEIRGVGRAQIPSTVIGLLFHAAEHTMRHLGQLLVTVRMVNSARA